MRSFWGEIRELIGEGWAVAKRNARFLAAGIVVVGILTILLFPYDAALLQAFAPNTETPFWARKFSFWGDFYTGTLIIGAVLWGASFLMRKKLKRELWKKAAIACVLAAAIAGIMVNCFRFTLGRPRPSAEVADGFYGLKKDASYHGFPSGHAATAFGTATAISVALPPLSAPAMAGAIGVAWARMRLRRHYVTDILVGGAIGILFGALLGTAVRNLVIRRGKIRGDTARRVLPNCSGRSSRPQRLSCVGNRS